MEDNIMKLSEMNLQQKYEWGSEEMKLRKKDLSNIVTEKDLQEAKRNGESRRKAINASASEAVFLIRVANLVDQRGFSVEDAFFYKGR
jgi:hypothetical protein